MYDLLYITAVKEIFYKEDDCVGVFVNRNNNDNNLGFYVFKARCCFCKGNGSEEVQYPFIQSEKIK